MSKTYEEIWDMTNRYTGIKNHTWAKTPVDGERWHLVFEYLDWKYNTTEQQKSEALAGLLS